MKSNSLEKTLILGGIEGRRRREQQIMRRLDVIIDSMDMSLRKFQKIVKERDVGMLQYMGLQRVGHDFATRQQ